jgi:mitogen-activated protein kinase 1/3
VGPDYAIEKMLGTGSYGKVALATKKSQGIKVAIKRMDNIFEDETDCKRILREISLMRLLRHPFLVDLVEVIYPFKPQTFSTLYIVMGYAESDLKKIIKSSINLEMLHIQTIIYNLLCAVKFLHDSNVLHRDLKPANVLLNEDCTIKLCDYGLARSTTGIQSAEIIIRKQQKDRSSSEEDFDSPIQLKQGGFRQMEIPSPQPVASPKTPSESKEETKEDLRNRLVKTKDARRNMKRELTGHVVTRWYRAPEIILLEKDYGPGIDIWAVGCIFAELLGMMQENAPTFMDRQPLFPGKSCFPLSPAKNPQEQRQGFPFSNQDQLAVIFAVVGTPSESDKSYVTDQKALEYLETFQYQPKIDLVTKYPGSSAEAIDFLSKVLVFNPYFRISLEECFEHPLFAQVRNKEKENMQVTPVNLAFEKEELNREKLRKLILNECQMSKQH